MYLSGYLKQFPCSDDPDRVVLFSTRWLSKAVVSRTVLDTLARGLLTDEQTATLSRLGFLVQDPAAERRKMYSVFSEAERRSGHAYVMVVMNLDCNLACTYCYQGQQRGQYYLSPATADLLVDFCVREYMARGKKLTIDFYGGEPLLSLAILKTIARKLQEAAGRMGTVFDFTLVTNGTLLSHPIVEALLPLGLKRARVTLDGPQENHDSYRPFVSGRGSFDIIARNLLSIGGLIGLGLAGNFTRDNYRSFPRLLDELVARGMAPRAFSSVIFAPVSPAMTGHLVPEFAEGCCSVDEPWVAAAGVYLREEILQRGFAAPRVGAATCMVDFADNMVVHYDGTLYKCPAFIGCEGFCVGHLGKGVTDYRESHGMERWHREECLECAYLPLCFGGCRFLSVVQGGSAHKIECRKAWLDAVLEDYVRQDITFLEKRQ